MKEIKFRAWDKNRKRMVIVTTLDFDGEGVLDKVFGKAKGKSVDGLEGFELMQFCGLKDKNGKEIYEGDIVQEFHDDEGKGHIINHEVSWSDGSWRLGNGGVDQNLLNGNGRKDLSFEVIGNIYENIELLK